MCVCMCVQSLAAYSFLLPFALFIFQRIYVFGLWRCAVAVVAIIFFFLKKIALVLKFFFFVADSIMRQLLRA